MNTKRPVTLSQKTPHSGAKCTTPPPPQSVPETLPPPGGGFWYIFGGCTGGFWYILGGCLVLSRGVLCFFFWGSFGQLRVSRSFGNEHFRVFPNVSESELDLLIPKIPNISEYEKGEHSGFGGIRGGSPVLWGMYSSMVHTLSTLGFSSVNTSMSVPTPDEVPSEQAQKLAPSGKQPSQASKFGKHMTTAKRAAQFPNNMTVRNDGAEMWCMHCGVRVQYEDENLAVQHTKRKPHQRLKKEGKLSIFAPRTATLKPEEQGAAVEQEQHGQNTSSTATPTKRKTPTLVQQQEADMQQMMAQLNQAANITDIFVAAAL